MYFASRMQAGRMMASQLKKKYSQEDCAVLALSDGGAVIGMQIAKELHCIVMLLLTAEITLPREIEALAGITSTGEFAYNQQYTPSEIEEMAGEYYNLVEQEKLVQMHNLNHVLGKVGTVNRRLLKDKNVILVSDGFKDGFSLDLAYQYLKPVAMKKIVIATPFAGIHAVDRMHILGDDLLCLNVIEDYTDTDHYYDKNDVPDHATVIKTIEEIVKNWQ